MSLLNQTHDPALKSWVGSANRADCDFPIQNLPFAVIRRSHSDEHWRAAIGIGDYALDLYAVYELQVFDKHTQSLLEACCEETLNRFMAMSRQCWSALRSQLSRALSAGSTLQTALAPCLIALEDVEFKLPCDIGDYTDFYTSIHHATRVGSIFRPDNPLLPNYKWVPIGYHGRASSIDISGQAVVRPCGQLKQPDCEVPVFGPCERLDYEMEVGIYLGAGNALGEAIAIDDADEHIFGMCLFNDWSARDIQGWEYQPLGPFLAKNFASTVSAWIVTNEALAPFRCAWQRLPEDPQPLSYLDSDSHRTRAAYDIQLQVQLYTQAMREQQLAPHTLSQSSFAESYWSVAQMLTHHTAGGCNMRPGDFFGSGTQSGPTREEAGSLLELSDAGKQTITLDNGEVRTFLEDGDTVIMRGFCEAENAVRIGFGECRGTVHPAKYTR